MEKIKKFKEFVNENLDELDMGNFVNGEMYNELDNEIDVSTDEIDNTIDDVDAEDEEIDDLLELTYNKDTETWDMMGELDLPSDFEAFYDWFVDELSFDETTTASMKEEDNEMVFHIPEDLYITYLEEIDKGVKDELDEIAQRDDYDDVDNYDSDDYDNDDD